MSTQMATSVKSLFKLGAKTIAVHRLDAIKDTITTHRPSIGNNDTYPLNDFIGESFFDGDNYRSIINCLDGGYAVSTDLIEFMQEYCDLLRAHAHALNSYSKKCKSKLKQQSSISSYHTTKRAQTQTVRTTEKIAQNLEALCDAIQRVIDQYKRQVDKMYPSTNLGATHKHCQTEVIKKNFKKAHSSLVKVKDSLENLREQEKRARTALRNADIQCQNLGLDPTTSKTKLKRANDTQQEKTDELASITARIAKVDEDIEKEEITYRKKATEIFEQCQELEEERLEQIRQTLLNLSQAIHSSEYATEYGPIYEELLSKIENVQNTSEDLEFWTVTYGVDTLTKSVSSETIESEHLTSTKPDEPQSVIENDGNEEEQPTEVATTTPVKTKVKKNKNTATTGKKNNTKTETTGAGLNEV